MYIANQLMKGNTALRDRLLRIGNALSSHSLFDPIFCQLTIHFVSDYLHRILLDPSALDQSVEMHTFLLLCLNSAFKGSNRLFMFDVNNHQSKFHHLYQHLKFTLFQSCEDYAKLEASPLPKPQEETEETVIVAGLSLDSPEPTAATESMGEEEWKTVVANLKVLVCVFLSDILTIVGKYMVYFENESPLSVSLTRRNALCGVLSDVDAKCGFLDLKKADKPSSVLLLYTILILSTIRSEESLLMYLKKSSRVLSLTRRIRQFKDVTLSFDLSVRLQSVLQNLSTSGGPLFPTVAVRHEAKETINTLYPVSERGCDDS